MFYLLMKNGDRLVSRGGYGTASENSNKPTEFYCMPYADLNSYDPEATSFNTISAEDPDILFIFTNSFCFEATRALELVVYSGKDRLNCFNEGAGKLQSGFAYPIIKRQVKTNTEEFLTVLDDNLMPTNIVHYF